MEDMTVKDMVLWMIDQRLIGHVQHLADAELKKDDLTVLTEEAVIAELNATREYILADLRV